MKVGFPVDSKFPNQNPHGRIDTKLQVSLVRKPDSGAIIQGTGGIRKTRWSGSGRGKRDGTRIIYYWVKSDHQMFMLMAYPKNEKDELSESIKEAGQIKKGKKLPSRFYVGHAKEAFAIRLKLGLSQSKFAALMGVTNDCVQNWEQGRRRPNGAAKVLLKIAEKHPQIVLQAARG